MDKKIILKEIEERKLYEIEFDNEIYQFNDKMILKEIKYSDKLNSKVMNFHLQIKKNEKLFEKINITNIIISKYIYDENSKKIIKKAENYFDKNHFYNRELKSQYGKEKRINQNIKVILKENLSEEDYKEYESLKSKIEKLESKANKNYQEKLKNDPDNLTKSELKDSLKEKDKEIQKYLEIIKKNNLKID